MNIEQKTLTDLGLTEIEASVYLACLELGEDTVLNIAKKAGVKRPTCYVTLNNLFEKGYVTKVEKKSTTTFSAEKPSHVLNKEKEKLANFQDLIPFFEAKFNRGGKPKIRYYEGQDDLWHVYTKILFPEDEIFFFGTDMQKVREKFSGLVDYWEKNYVEKYNKIKEIVSSNKAGVEYMNRCGSMRPIRLMPKDLPVFADAAITHDKVFIVSLDNMFGILIESEDIAQTFKNFFELAWKAAEKK